MGCRSSQEVNTQARVPRVSHAPEDLAEYVAAANRRLAHEESVIPCEHTGVLHSNWTGPSRGFCSMEAVRQYHAMHVERINEFGGNVLRGWPRIDADFAVQHFSVSGSAPLPYRKLQPRIRQAMQKSEAQYRKVFSALPEEDRAIVRGFEGLWPALSAEDLKECCVQPDEAATLRLTYAVGVQRLEQLYQFSVALARLVGAGRKVEWSVKRPWRLWRKTIDGYPSEFADNDFRHICDVFRTSVVVETLEQVRHILEVLEGLGRDAYDPASVMQLLGLGGSRASFVVERIKNRFVQPCPGGYMDLIANVRIDGYVAEVQVHVAELLDAKGETGRQLYKWFRKFSRQHSVYKGERAEDGLMHGSGTFLPATGGRYDGQFRGGLRHGEGTFYYTNGDCYEGQFQAGKKHGAGTFSYASGDRYKGEFADDRMEGRGAYTFVSGERYEGEYCEGKRHGEGAYFYNNGSCVSGDWWRNKHVSVESV